MSLRKVVVLSDLHPGDPASHFERHDIQRRVIEAIAEEGPVDEMVLLGDVLDLDYGTLPIAVEGRPEARGDRGAGLRHFLQGICRDADVRRIVYVPGNHDYFIFDALATQTDALRPLDAGEALDYEPMFSGEWTAPFLRGLMTHSKRGDLTVRYPNRVMQMAGLTILFTHGHHLDRHQTLWMPIQEVVESSDLHEAKREFFGGIAGYQTFVHAVSYARRTRRLAYLGVRWISRLFRRVASLRGKRMSASLRGAIEIYARHFSEGMPDVFIFGHTHVPGHWQGPRLMQPHKSGRPLAIYNSGAFVAVEDAAGTFLLLAAEDERQIRVDLAQVSESGELSRRRLPGP